jgi:hypothetical protein
VRARAVSGARLRVRWASARLRAPRKRRTGERRYVAPPDGCEPEFGASDADLKTTYGPGRARPSGGDAATVARVARSGYIAARCERYEDNRFVPAGEAPLETQLRPPMTTRAGGGRRGHHGGCATVALTGLRGAAGDRQRIGGARPALKIGPK